MAQTAGQMLPTGDARASGPLWVSANAARFNRFVGGKGGGYFQRIGWLSGMVGIGRFMVPNAPGWVVLLDDNPAGTTLPADTPTAARPPVAVPPTVTIAAVANHAAGAVPVSGTVSPGATAVSCAPLIAGVEGTYVPMTVTGTTWSGNVTMVVGTGVQIRARVTAMTVVRADSNTFNVT
jgi:hypothetical protein